MAPVVKHPAERTGAILIALGVALFALGLLTLSGPSAPVVGPLALVAALIVALGAYSRASGPMAMLINRSVNALRLGQFDEARTLLTDAESRSGSRFFRRPILMQRSQLALHDGHPDEALALVEQASALRLGMVNREFARMQRDEARAWVALLRAGRGDAGGARAAMAEAISDAASPTARARVLVAELVLLSRAGDLAELRRTLEDNRALFFEATAPGERALVRGFERMLDQARPSPYREPGETRAREGSLGVASWISELAPEAAEYVAAAPPAAGSTAAIQFDAPSAEVEERMKREQRVALPAPTHSLTRIAAGVGIGLAVCFGVVASSIGLVPSGPGHSLDAGARLLSTTLVLGGAFLATFVGLVVRARHRTRTGLRALRDAGLAITLNDHARARDLLTPLLRSPLWSFQATAALQLSGVDEREADFAKALTGCDTALALSSGKMRRAAGYDFLLPLVHSHRAFLLAVLGRQEESSAEASRLAREFPSFALRAAAELRIKLAQLLRRGEVAEAARLGRERSVYIQLSRRDELLFDVLDAVDRPTDDQVRGRLARQIDGEAQLGRWFSQVAPGLVDRLRASRPGPGVRVALSSPSSSTPDSREEPEEALPPESPRRLASRA